MDTLTIRAHRGIVCGAVLLLAAARAATVTFDGLPLAGPDSFWNGSDGSGGFSDQGAHFRNVYDDAWGSWSGFAYSNVDAPDVAGWGNQYAAASGTGVGGGGQYAIGYPADAMITFDQPVQVLGFEVNNTAYAALAMRDGDPFAKQFGGLSGTDPDWFLLTINASTADGSSLDPVLFYLADFRPDTPDDDYIVTDWTSVDLTGFGPSVTALNFTLSSSDVGMFGMNTPGYFAMDNLQFIPEPGTGALAALGGLTLLWTLRRGARRSAMPGER